jgi:hypothetical protein
MAKENLKRVLRLGKRKTKKEEEIELQVQEAMEEEEKKEIERDMPSMSLMHILEL